jgi:hypothetical protein
VAPEQRELQRHPWHGALEMNLLHLIGDNSISDVPHGPGLAFERAMFGMLIFLVGPNSGGGGAALDGVAHLGPAFTFFMAGLFNTAAFHFLIAACEATE